MMSLKRHEHGRYSYHCIEIFQNVIAVNCKNKWYVIVKQVQQRHVFCVLTDFEFFFNSVPDEQPAAINHLKNKAYSPRPGRFW